MTPENEMKRLTRNWPREVNTEQIRPKIVNAITAAVQVETTRCAGIAREFGERWSALNNVEHAGDKIAEAIEREDGK